MKNKEYYMELNYPIVLSKFFDEDELLYSASIVELPGLEVVGDSFEEVLEDIEDAKVVWLETALGLGKIIKEPENQQDFSGRLTLRLPVSLHRMLSNNAKAEKVSLNSYIQTIISVGLTADSIISGIKTQLFTINKSLFEMRSSIPDIRKSEIHLHTYVSRNAPTRQKYQPLNKVIPIDSGGRLVGNK